ncbi:hypothetical protein MP228_010046 [Amoeboaphelidium protococcarum]|nr:hypothetical protein MP228_010046 [Amoeboaphelidium protococcarum]
MAVIGSTKQGIKYQRVFWSTLGIGVLCGSSYAIYTRWAQQQIDKVNDQTKTSDVDGMNTQHNLSSGNSVTTNGEPENNQNKVIYGEDKLGHGLEVLVQGVNAGRYRLTGFDDQIIKTGVDHFAVNHHGGIITDKRGVLYKWLWHNSAKSQFLNKSSSSAVDAPLEKLSEASQRLWYNPTSWSSRSGRDQSLFKVGEDMFAINQDQSTITKYEADNLIEIEKFKVPFKVKSVQTMGSGGNQWLYILSVDGKLYQVNFKFEVQKQLPANFKMSSLSCGSKHCIGLTDDQQLYGFGSNEHGQLAESLNILSIDMPSILRSFWQNMPKNYTSSEVVSKCVDAQAIGNVSVISLYTHGCSKRDDKTLQDTFSVWSIGDGQSSLLGQSNAQSKQFEPKKIRQLSDQSQYDEGKQRVVPIRISEFMKCSTHMLAVMETCSSSSPITSPQFGDDVYGWGENARGQLNQSSRGSIHAPTLLQSPIYEPNVDRMQVHQSADHKSMKIRKLAVCNGMVAELVY